jgi:hypothetical protein
MKGLARGHATDRLSRTQVATLGSLAAIAALLLVAGCQSSAPVSSGTAAAPATASSPVDRAALEAALGQCIATTGYDPVAAQASLGENELGAGELEWRSCAYDALNTVVRPKLFQPEAIDDLIEDDKRLTQGIVDGTSTRSERHAEVVARVDNIRQQELALRASVDAATGAAQDQALDDMQSDLAYAQMRSDIDMISSSFR